MPRRDAASRVVAAPPGRVFAALVDREALAAWLPPDGMTGTVERFDPQPGGSYRMVLTHLDTSRPRGKSTADADVVEARYVDVVPGTRVVQAVDFDTDDPALLGPASRILAWPDSRGVAQ
ncbi:MAG TPA: SRPBCC domain-containing protein [Acidimicrobiales bacterium]|nr:SRPBCC domain-containing protein [Acidimicrobiales bacterium]